MAGKYTQLAIVAGFNTTTLAPVVMTSPDLVNWTTVASWPGGAADQVSVAGDTYWVITATEFAGNNYAYSFDGANWTLGSTSPSLQSVAWTGTNYVAVRESGATAYTTPIASTAWGGAVSTGTSGTFRQVASDRNGTVVGVLTTGSGQPPIFYSTDDGASWSTHTPANNTFGALGVAYGAAGFVVVRARFSGGSDSVIVSASGTSWTTVTTGHVNHAWYRVAYGGGKYLAIGINNSSQTRTMSSTDGTTWTLHTPSGLPAGVSQAGVLTWWAGLFAFVPTSSGTIYTSSDGITWTGTTFANRDWRGIAAGLARPRGRRGLGLIRG